MMRQHNFFTTLFYAVFFMAVFSGSVLADQASEQIRNSFNGMNNGQGYLFKWRDAGIDTTGFYGSKSGEIRLVNAGNQTPDLLAYKIGTTANVGTGTNFHFQTFCVAPELISNTSEPLQSQLNYNSNQTITFNGTALTLGVAYLYKEFAAGNLTGYNYDYGTNRVTSAVLLQDAIWHLMGLQGQDRIDFMADPSTDWNNNNFLSYLKNTYPTIDWLEIYDPANNYNGLMGSTKVFVMNVSGGDDDPWWKEGASVRQDVLYVTNVCEPATILLWTFGSLGAAGVFHRKRRKTL